MGGFSYPDNYIVESEFSGFEFGIVGAFLVIYLLFMFLLMAFSVVAYVLQGLGMYTIAGRRGIKNNWLAWVPLGNLWILGSISDQYQYLAKGKIKNRRKTMLGLSIGLIVVYVVWIIGAIVGLIMADGSEAGTVIGPLLIVFGALFMVAAAIILVVTQYMCLYDLFASCQPDNAVLYLVLSIFFSVTLPFFVFFCRNKDLGMPPRKTAPVQVIPEPAEEPDAPVEEGFANPDEFED